LAITVHIVDLFDPANYNRRDWPDNGILFFSDEWHARRMQCNNLIIAARGESRRKLHARKCLVRVLDQSSAREFIDINHIQGPNRLAVVYFGLLHDDELVGVVSLGRHSRQISKNRIVLDRLCFGTDICVRGGASKLFKACVEWAKTHHYDEIISFSDNRWTQGGVYSVLGFTLEKEYKPDYSYVDTNDPLVRLSKQSQKKSSAKCPKGMTEYDWAKVRGLERVWDRGKKRWVYCLHQEMSWREALSYRCAKQHATGTFKHSHIRGYFWSDINQSEVYYGSSYELRCLYLLERTAKSFCRAGTFKDRDGKWRNPDIQATYQDGSVEIIEVKPMKRLREPEVTKQITETKHYSKENGFNFKVWTERDSSLAGEKEIIQWAKKYIAETNGDVQWLEKQKENNRKRAKRHYQNRIAVDKVEVVCEYCGTTHTPLRKTYEKNVTRNGRYICGREGGHIAGKNPSPNKGNPHAKDGKKMCARCNQILEFDQFGKDKSRADGLASRCKKCRRKEANEKYQSKK